MSSGITQHNQASLEVMFCHWASSGVIGCHWASSGVIGCHRVSLGVYRYHRVSPGVIGCHHVSLVIIRRHWASSSDIGRHWRCVTLTLSSYPLELQLLYLTFLPRCHCPRTSYPSYLSLCLHCHLTGVCLVFHIPKPTMWFLCRRNFHECHKFGRFLPTGSIHRESSHW